MIERGRLWNASSFFSDSFSVECQLNIVVQVFSEANHITHIDLFQFST